MPTLRDAVVVPEAAVTLYHVVLDRSEQARAEVALTSVEPVRRRVPSVEKLVAGETSFTIARLEAIQTVLMEYHHGEPSMVTDSRTERAYRKPVRTN